MPAQGPPQWGRRDVAAARRFFTRALRTLKVIPGEVVTDAAPIARLTVGRELEQQTGADNARNCENLAFHFVRSGDRLRGWLAEFGAEVELRGGALTVAGQGAPAHPLQPVDLDLGAGGELAPTLVGLAAFADGTSTFTGIGHLRGHETDRLAALITELGAVGIAVEETPDGLIVHGGRPVAGDRAWRSYADHRIATTGALLGLATPGLAVEDVATTAKTLPGFVELWTRMLS